MSINLMFAAFHSGAPPPPFETALHADEDGREKRRQAEAEYWAPRQERRRGWDKRAPSHAADEARRLS